MSVAGPLCALLSSFTWAIGVSVYSRLSQRFAPATINTTRALLGMPAFALFVLIEAGGVGEALRAILAVPGDRLGWLAVSMVASYALGDALFLRSTHFLGVPAALSIASVYPLWAAMAGVLFRGEPLSLARLCGVLLIIAGTVIVISSSRGRAEAAVRPAIGVGVLLALATSFMWALNGYAVAEGSRGLSLGVASFWRTVVALVLVPLVGLLTPRLMGAAARPPLLLPAAAVRRSWWAIVLEGFCGTLFFTYGLRESPLAVGAALSSLAPVLAVPIALLTRTERFSGGKSLGIALVMGGIFLLVG